LRNANAQTELLTWADFMENCPADMVCQSLHWAQAVVKTLRAMEPSAIL